MQVIWTTSGAVTLTPKTNAVIWIDGGAVAKPVEAGGDSVLVAHMIQNGLFVSSGP